MSVPDPGMEMHRPRRMSHRGGPAKPKVARLPQGTSLGRRAGLLGLALLFAGFNTGNNLFYLVFAVMAASELLGFFVCGRVLRRMSVEIAAPGRGRAGTPLRLTLRLSNHSRWLPVPALRWRIGAEDGDWTELATPALAPGGFASGTARLVPARRGRMRLSSAEASTAFPLGFARRTASLRDLSVETLITPRLERARPAPRGSRRGDVRQLARPKGSGEEPQDAREYRPGDEARRIDWKATARLERLIWRDRRGEPPQALRITLDRSGVPGPAFERRVSRAAGAAVAGLASGRAVGFASDEFELLPRSGPAQRRKILDYLALVRPRSQALFRQEAAG